VFGWNGKTSQNQLRFFWRLLDELVNKKISRKEFVTLAGSGVVVIALGSPPGKVGRFKQHSIRRRRLFSRRTPQNPSEPGITSPCEQAIHPKKALSALNL